MASPFEGDFPQSCGVLMKREKEELGSEEKITLREKQGRF